MSDKLHFLWVGETKNGALSQLERDYLERIGRFFPSSVITVPADKNRSRSTGEIRDAESRRLLEAVPDGATLVVLDERGKHLTSKEFASWLDERLQSNPHGVAFVTGGDLGLSAEIRKRAAKVLALSMMTLPHEMARVILLEQVYRSCTLVRGIRYHK